jgi:putative oxidoreductase
MRNAHRPEAVPDQVLAFIGKLLIASLFWRSGIFDFVMTWPSVVADVAAKGVPVPMLAAAGATALEILAPVCLFVRWLEPWGALALALYCMLTAAVFHNFWTLQGDDRWPVMIHFYKNLALAGALLIVVARRRPGRR